MDSVTSPEQQEYLAALDKVLNSRTLQGSETLRTFLRYIVVQSISNPGIHLKEYTIASDVFGRNSNYDPRTDSVVRVQASRLRAKLQDYYANEGKTDKILIALPKGHYNPVLSYTNVENGAVEESSANQRQGVPATAPAARSPLQATVVAEVRPGNGYRGLYTRVAKWVTPGLVVTCVILALLSARWGSAAGVFKTDKKAATDPNLVRFWSPLLKSSDPILVSYGNPRFLGRPDTGMRLASPDQQAPTGDVTDQYVGVGEVVGVSAIGQMLARLNHEYRVKRGQMLTWDDLKTENVVVLGSPAENPLLAQLPQQQDFVFKTVRGATGEHLEIVNTRPRPGEASEYYGKSSGPRADDISEDYAVVSVLKGLKEDRGLLVLAGTTTFGTQGAAEYITDPDHLRELYGMLDAAGNDSAVNYQVLIKITLKGGVPVQMGYVTHHVLR